MSTRISEFVPLPGREGLEVGWFPRTPRSKAEGCGRREPPTPSPSLPGRGAAAVSLILLAACGQKLEDKAAIAKAARSERAIAEAEGKIECLTPGAQSFAYVCAIDRTQSQDGLYLTLRHPDGGFRRLLVTKDGRGVIAADGAEQAQVTPLADDLIEVSIAGAHYRLPATVRGQRKTKP